MDKRQRIALQRSMCREAMAKLLAAAEFFGTEDEDVKSYEDAESGKNEDYAQFIDRIGQLNAWIFQESSLA